MIPILYEKTETSFTSNGICRLRDIISCVVSEERNGIYEVDFEYPVTGANFDKITLGRIIACEHDDTNDIQPFDIISCSKPINGVVSFHGVHISYRLNNAVVSGTNINSLSDAITLMGNGEPSNGFNFSADFVASGYMASADGIPKTVRSMLGGVEGSILETYGGEFEFRKFNVTLHQSRGVNRAMSIRYGTNLVDYTEEIDYSEAYDCVIPYWTGDDGTGAETIIKGDLISSGVPPYNGRRNCLPFDVTDKFETAPTKATIEAYARSYMSANQTYLPQRNITIDFIRLQDSNEYVNYSQLYECRLCDTVQVEFPMYGVSGAFKIVKTVYNVLRDKYDEMELGSLSTSLAEALGVGSGGSSFGSSSNNINVSGNITAGGSLFSNGAFEFSRESGENHVIIGGLHVCFGSVTITSTANAYKEEQVTFPYTYTSQPCVVASSGNRTAQVRTVYATQGSLAGNKCYIGVYATASRTCYIDYIAIGV